MSDQKADVEKLLDAFLPFAEKMLAQHGEFLPFGGAMKPSGEIESVAAHDGREQPPSQDVIDLLAEGLQRGAAAGEYIATAIVYDVRVRPPGQADVTDAIAAELEHQGGYAVITVFPYRINAGLPQLSPPYATGPRRSIFGKPETSA